MPEMVGKYVYSDAGSGRVWALTYDFSSLATNDTLINKQAGIVSIPAWSRDTSGDLLALGWTDYNGTNRIYRLVNQNAGIFSHDASPFSVSVSPNPFTDEIYLSITGPSHIQEITFTDVLGKITRIERPSNKLTIRTQDLKLHPGTYILSVSDGKNSVTQNVVCVR
jgi:hypothetical protein